MYKSKQKRPYTLGTEYLDNRAIELHRQHMSSIAIGQELGYSSWRIRRLIRDRQEELFSGPTFWTKEKLDFIVAEHEYYTIAGFARHFGCTKEAISQQLTRLRKIGRIQSKTRKKKNEQD